MEVASVLLSLLLILVTARILGEVASLLGAPSVIGELSAGILIGPSVLGWVSVNDIIHTLSEIGVILLLFDVGRETDIEKLIQTGKSAFIVALGGFIAPFAAGFAASFYIFQQPVIVALFVGGTLTATSIGITVRTLSDMHRQNSREGQITLGAAVLDDILGVILLALLYELSITGNVNWINSAKVLVVTFVFFILAPLFAKLLSTLIRWLDLHITNPGLIPTAIISLVLFFAWLAHLFGAPALLGGFAAGLALSRRFFLPFGLSLSTDTNFLKKIDIQIRPIIQLFTPFFFVTVGLSLDLTTMNWHSSFFWTFSMIIGVIAIATKFTGALFIHETFPRKIIVGMNMVPRGEVGLIFAGLGASAGIFTGEIYTGLIIVIAYTTLFSPFWIKRYYRKFGKRLSDSNTV